MKDSAKTNRRKKLQETGTMQGAEKNNFFKTYNQYLLRFKGRYCIHETRTDAVKQRTFREEQGHLEIKNI